MQWSATKLRWLLLAGALVLAGVVAGFFGIARYRAGKIWQRILARNGINLQRDSNGVTWSQSSGGRTIFTLHASKVTPEGKDKWAAHDAVLILYGHQPGREDRIYGKEFEYDQNEGVARAVGEVHMDLQAPEPKGEAGTANPRPDFGFGPDKEAAADPGLIHVRTSGLVYMRKLGIAATGQPTEFRYGGTTCLSRGAEFDSGPSVVRLLAEVRMTGMIREAPFTLTAAHAELDRGANTADLTSTVLTSADRSARAAHALVHLHKDGSLAAADASGGVETRAGTQTIASPQVSVSFAAGNQPARARWSTGVRFADGDRSRPAQGSAAALEFVWTSGGALSTGTAEGAVKYSAWGTDGNGSATSRRLGAEKVVASFVSDQSIGRKRALLRQVHMTGNAELHSSAQTSGHADRPAATDVSGDDLTAGFRQGESRRPELQQLHGVGHTVLEQVAVDGSRQRSQGEALDIDFAQGTGSRSTQAQVVSAVQAGHVELRSWAVPKALAGPPGSAPAAGELTSGHGGRAVFSQADQTLTLEGSPGERATLEQSQGVLAGERVVLHGGSGDAEASGGVIATSWAQGSGRDGRREATPATHVEASRARLLHAAGLSEFYGEPGHPAQLWQGASQVLAAEITLNGKTKGVTANPEGGGLVEAVFAAEQGRVEKKTPETGSKAQPAAEERGPGVLADGNVPEAGRSAVRVSAARMDYDDAHHEAVFTGSVRMRGVMGEASAQRGNAFLRAPGAGGAGALAPVAEPGLNGTLDRMVLLGGVRLIQPGRAGGGEQLTYTAATDSFVLTGTAASPPRVTGEGGSVVTGATLLFRTGESTIVVAGAKGSPKAAGPARVHTETDLKP